MSDPLLGVRVKIDRAKKHCVDLDNVIRAFKSRQPYFVEVDLNTQPGYEIHRFREREQIPVESSAILGDCIHNMRSALDHLANALVLENGGTPTQYTAFPVGSSETNFRTSGLQRVKGASDTAIKLIETLNPYKGGNAPLYGLHILDVTDKHQLLVPVFVANHTLGVDAGVGQAAALGFGREWMRGNVARGPAPLKDRDELFRLEIATGARLQRYPEFKFGFEIAFSKIPVFSRKVVVPTVNELLHMTNGIIETFASAIFGVAWQQRQGNAL